MVSNTSIARNIIRYILYKKIDESVDKLIKEIESEGLERLDTETQDDRPLLLYNGNTIKKSLETAIEDFGEPRDREETEEETKEFIDKEVVNAVKEELERLENFKLPGIGDARSILLKIIKDKLQYQIKVVLSAAEELVGDNKYSDLDSEVTQKFIAMKKRHFYNADLSKLICEESHPAYQEIKRLTTCEIFPARCSAYMNLIKVFPKVVQALPEINFSKLFDSNGDPAGRGYAGLIEETIYPMVVQMRWQKQDEALKAYLVEFEGQEKVMDLINEDMSKYRKRAREFKEGKCEDPEKEKWILLGKPPLGLDFYKISPDRMRTVFWFLLNRVLAYGKYEINSNISEVYSKTIASAQLTT